MDKRCYSVNWFRLKCKKKTTTVDMCVSVYVPLTFATFVIFCASEVDSVAREMYSH